MDSTREDWTEATRRLSAGEARLVDLWADDGAVCLALADPDIRILRLACPDGGFPSVGAAHPGAIRLERALADLHGLTPEAAPDARPWLDHGRFDLVAPLGRAAPRAVPLPPYAFRAAEGPGLHQIPVGPIHAGIIEPGHFRFHASGETVVRLEERLGYLHKGVEGLARGATVADGAYGACCAEVAIDTLTGETRVLAADILHDVGSSLNPAIDLGQVEGAFAQGMGWVTTEELVWDGKGRLTTHAPATYKIPVASDMPPRFNTRLWLRPNATQSIYRSKAVGEPPFMHGIAVYCAILDAVHACAAHGHPDLPSPATPEAVLRAVDSLG